VASLVSGSALEVPRFERIELRPRRTRQCLVVTVLDEGDRIRRQLARMAPRASLADIVIADGDSQDGATAPSVLAAHGVRTLLVTRERGLATALRMGLFYGLEQGYQGVVTVDGNDKDGVESLPDFLAALDEGYDFVQGSRYMRGGQAAHTPVLRHLGIRLVAAPILSVAAKRLYTDPTNGFKAMSRAFLCDPRVQPFRSVFVRFNLQMYLNVRAGQLGFRTEEIPVRRVYPADGSLPTKITTTRLVLAVAGEMLAVAAGRYDPPVGTGP
jgi:hypothetical protein